MMEGSTVLSENELMVVPNWVGIIVLVGMIIMLISLIVIVKMSNIYFSVILCVIGIVLAIVGIFGNLTIRKSTGEYEYRVTISDEVSLVEFNEKYEIINQEGLIYTIRKKEINNE